MGHFYAHKWNDIFLGPQHLNDGARSQAGPGGSRGPVSGAQPRRQKRRCGRPGGLFLPGGGWNPL